MASNSDHDKPLPTLPKRHDSPKLTTLSVEARKHIRRFILHALEEESPAVAGNDRNYEREAWANGISDALDSLGDGIATGGWIVGANRSRRASIQRKLVLRDTEQGSTTADAVTEPKSIAVSDLPKHTPDPPPPQPPDSTVMEQISLWLSKALPPSPKPYAKHLLLTVSAGGHAPDNASDFELVPPAIGCSFSLSRFVLPHPATSSEHADREEGIILYGLNEWDGQFSSSRCISPVQSRSLAS
jgi:1-phosphatidylinositol-3-phosphate 5-kinase